ncbi:MAG TPA: hypothetical protein VFZ22_15195 [Pyrinomonadaceae bacterium]|nr:hypothetical protein [Pyrinomonadaceae bacterium]
MNNTLKFTSLICALLIFPAFASAQTRPMPPSEMDPSTTRERPMTEMEAEMKAKLAIKYAEKGYQENLDRAKEIAQIGKELKSAVTGKALLNSDSQKKIERLEKLTRKIRSEAGGGDQEVDLHDRPTDVPSTVTRIAEAAETLSKDVQNTPRQVVSTSVIENANVLLELIKIVRTFAR